MTRSYRQECLLAYSLDLLGERWTLLVVRELMLGPQRFADMQATLSGIGPTLLSKRLKDLEDAGLVERTSHEAKGPYRLTDLGECLRPVLAAIMHFGVGYFLAAGGDHEAVRCILSNDLSPDSVALAAEALAISCALGTESFVAHVVIDEEPYTYFFVNGELKAKRGDDAPAAARIELDGATMLQMLRRETTFEAAHKRIRVTGDEVIARRVIDGVLHDALDPAEMEKKLSAVTRRKDTAAA